MGFLRKLKGWFCVVLIAAGAAQMRSSLNGSTFRNEDIGLTYTLPQGLAPAPNQKVPQDPHGREFIILALWDTPRKTPIPRVTFLYDTKEAPAKLTPEEVATRFLQAMSRNREGYKMSDPRRVSIADTTMWRMDYWRPDDSGQSFNSAVIIPLKDRKLLFIQMNAPTQAKLDSLIDTLRELHFDKR